MEMPCTMNKPIRAKTIPIRDSTRPTSSLTGDARRKAFRICHTRALPRLQPLLFEILEERLSWPGIVFEFVSLRHDTGLRAAFHFRARGSTASGISVGTTWSRRTFFEWGDLPGEVKVSPSTSLFAGNQAREIGVGSACRALSLRFHRHSAKIGTLAEPSVPTLVCLVDTNVAFEVGLEEDLAEEARQSSTHTPPTPIHLFLSMR
jgi:hypothetical protein